MAVLGLCCCVGFSWLQGAGPLSSCVQASHCSGFSCCEAQVLGRVGFGTCGL